MAKFAINEEGVAALKQLSADLTENIEKIVKATSGLENTCESCRSDLGPHVESLSEVIEEVREISSRAADPIESLSEKALEYAQDFEEIIANDRFKGISGN
jgi:methyl-accepting chemotaxis protein